MREILFRGKRVDNGEWVEGSLTVNHYDRAGKLEDEYRIVDACYGLDDEDLPTYQSGLDEAVVPSSVGQYTGLTDKNGKKIFEGDIISIAQKSDSLGTYFHPPVRYPVNAIVKWDLCSWLWECTQDGQTWYIQFPDAWCHFEYEVVGNIYDNPELIGGEKQ